MCKKKKKKKNLGIQKKSEVWNLGSLMLPLIRQQLFACLLYIAKKGQILRALSEIHPKVAHTVYSVNIVSV